MILVDVFVPSVDKIYDFLLNENIKIELVIEEIAEMVGQKERCTIVGNISELQLCDKRQRVLDRENTLKGNGIATGERLILV